MKTEIGRYPARFTNDKKLTRPANRRVMQVITCNWEELRRLAEEGRTCYRGVTREDVLLDTFEHVVRDQRLRKLPEKMIIDVFIKEYKQLYYRAVKNYQAERRGNNGVDIQAEGQEQE